MRLNLELMTLDGKLRILPILAVEKAYGDFLNSKVEKFSNNLCQPTEKETKNNRL